MVQQRDSKTQEEGGRKDQTDKNGGGSMEVHQQI